MENEAKRSQDEQLTEALKVLRVKGETDFFFFAKEICEFGLNPSPRGPRITEDQRELCDFLQSVYEEKLQDKKSDVRSIVLCPRGTLKSTVLQAFALWIACKNPDTRILFYGEVHEQAQKRLAVIKRLITTCKTFRLCYGELDGSRKSLPWNESIAVIANRKNMSIREATFETAGLDVVVNSRHFDWIFPDDLHSEKNTGSKDQIEGVAEKVRLLTPLLDEGSKMVFAGVFWNDADFHTQLIDGEKCNVFRRSAYKDEGKTISAYPNVFSINGLREKADGMTENEFSCHYLLNPISDKSQMFPKMRFQIIPKASFNSIRNILVIDPAGDPTSSNAERRDSDYYGMELWALNSAQEFLLLDGFNEKCSPTEAIEYALALINRHKPFVIGIERAAVGNLKYYLQEEMRKRGQFAICDDLLPNGRSKLMRVSAMEPIVRRRKVYIAEECPIKDEFLDQVSRISVGGIKAKHDDLIDPFGYIPDIIRNYGMPLGQVDTNAIPDDLKSLDDRSRDYWWTVRKNDKKTTNAWAEEFNL